MTLLLLGGLSLLSAVPTWLSTTASTALDASVDVTVSGTTAAPGVSAAALVVVAAALSLGLVGRAARWVSLLVVALGGAVIGGSALSFVLSPDAAARSGVAEATGVARSGAAVDISVAPYVTVVLGAVVVVVAAWAAFAPVDWGKRSRRYDAPSAPHGSGPQAARPGEKSTQVAPGHASGAAGTATTPAATDAPGSPVEDQTTSPGASTAPALDERDTWDSLTQGDDPT
ncbi:Trp biosynthesis-associated membrane protein [Sanguibacter sp. 4.1]|uniref:Trp biosynthesis-associated membrane protein n=1 Tax=Sanguibacter biliveldensis TaxID=3030830 RepID=A0AAF0Z541_9MICO|nr:Trp biosynthesis-associated membrane protein [Sanguibacter sp. 4.1]WPF80804.1 Trp biosynthesis-associated membrane protein [Sanguibacter sp. 4.1]